MKLSPTHRKWSGSDGGGLGEEGWGEGSGSGGGLEEEGWDEGSGGGGGLREEGWE